MRLLHKPSSHLFLLVLPLLALSGPVGASGGRILVDEKVLPDDQTVDINLPFGDVLVEAASSEGTLSASLTVDCDRSSEKCRARAERVQLVLTEKGGRLKVEVDGAARGSALGLTLRLRVSLPANQPTGIDLGAGNVSTRGLLGQLEIDVGVGDIEVALPQPSLRRVKIDTGIGSARLTTDLGEVRGTGVVGSGLIWSQSIGTAEIEVDTGIGDILVETQASS